ncbi:ABC transporter substrate-binding protein [Paracraurococcus ruber]|uniref:ABC transporter substrate-binding protein n=1 Tax=Paracraurococcus ruber TaxID=77675 RepID=A0ABS1CYW4_9PROT|nr:sugar ABC transporter substrate-binding protein [Paracraurococcus ruber]MBK1659729.1 ABC transporter substrate-binding protein [Paracraurococcus ruber]TDG27309.1 sugar ABC transporter substrate-binding protein [Paracraurococcus ruber]
MSGITRRMALRAGAASILVPLAAPGQVERANAQSRFDWRRFRGERIEVTVQLSPRGQFLQRNNQEFEDLTGIKVGLEVVPEQQHRQKIIVEYASGRPSFDVTEVSLHVNKRQVGKAKWNTDIRPLIADASLTAPDFEFGDYGQGMVQYATQADGRLDSCPAGADYFILYYNKELLAARNVAVPTTWDEMFEAAKRLADPSKQIHGHIGRGLKNANVVLWSSYLLGTAQRDMIDANRQLITDTPDAVWAGETYKKFLRDVSPPGSIGFNWNECQTTFMQGRAAMWVDGIGFAAPLEDKARSRIAGKVGYAVVPRGPGPNHHCALFGAGYGIPEASRKKGPAWFYIQWALGKSNQLKWLTSGAGVPARSSPFRNEEAIAQSHFPRDFFQTLEASARIARAGLPEIVPVTQFRDVIGTALTNSISGADVATELRRATAEFRPILEQSERES